MALAFVFAQIFFDDENSTTMRVRPLFSIIWGWAKVLGDNWTENGVQGRWCTLECIHVLMGRAKHILIRAFIFNKTPTCCFYEGGSLIFKKGNYRSTVEKVPVPVLSFTVPNPWLGTSPSRQLEVGSLSTTQTMWHQNFVVKCDIVDGGELRCPQAILDPSNYCCRRVCRILAGHGIGCRRTRRRAIQSPPFPTKKQWIFSCPMNLHSQRNAFCVTARPAQGTHCCTPKSDSHLPRSPWTRRISRRP